MSLGVFRAKAYAFGALAGALTTVALFALRDGKPGRGLFVLLVAALFGLGAVANEEEAQLLDEPAQAQ
jgi:hypothetical protein